jgi:carboxypeptidase C (cathepsin A)
MLKRTQWLTAMLAVTSFAWGQGGGRGRGAQQTGSQAAPPQQQTAAPGGGRGGAPAGASSDDFYNYDTNTTLPFTLPSFTPSEAHQKVSLNGETLAYTARAGFLALHNATTGASEAHLFYTSYSKDSVSDAGSRPLLMFFGGAPGMAAAWQEFGGLGPKRAKLDGGWTENPNTMLGQADLVFVNPVGTGFSRSDQPNRASSFWTSANDVASLAEFVRTYLERNKRYGSPLYLAGEDRGTGRVAGLAAYLSEHDIPVHGVVLLNVALSADSTAGDAQYLTLLPSLTMSAWVHKKLSADLNAMSAEQIAGQARQFASREYLHALYKGDRISAEERTKAIADLSRLTGLPKAVVVSNDLRISLDRFGAELMREQHGALSPSDARVAGFAPTLPGGRGGGGGGGFGGAAPAPIDFNLSERNGPFLGAYEAYLREELGFTGAGDWIYYLVHGGVGEFTGASDDASLASALARNPAMSLFVGINYYDLSVPFYAQEFTLAHLSVSPAVRAHNITVGHYEAGEMTYLDDKELAKLHRDLANFLSQPIRK